MREIRYADEGMDMKKLALCFVRKIWLVLLAAVIGAAAGSVAYTVARAVPESEREYQAMSKVYLDFAADETGEVYQEYNGYTWNDLMATDPILDVTMRYLPEDYTREEVMEATKAEILSDLRLLTITVTTHNADRCDAILKATGQSLTDRGQVAKEFRQIEVIRTTEAKPVVADSRMLQAVLIGLVLTVAVMLAGMLLYYVLDDRILVAADLRQVTDVLFIGYAGADGRLGQDYADNLAYLKKKQGNVIVCSLKRQDTPQEETWQELYGADGVVLEIPYGKIHAVYLDYIMEQFRVRECCVAGVAIGGADGKFLKRYYGMTVQAAARQQAKRSRRT